MKVYKVNRISSSLEMGAVVIANDEEDAIKFIKKKVKKEGWLINKDELAAIELEEVDEIALIDPMDFK